MYCGVQVCIQLFLGLYRVLVLLVGIQMVQDMDQHVSELSPNHAIVLYSAVLDIQEVSPVVLVAACCCLLLKVPVLHR